MAYLRIALRLGVMAPGPAGAEAGGGEGGAWLAELLSWFEQEVQSQGFKW